MRLRRGRGVEGAWCNMPARAALYLKLGAGKPWARQARDNVVSRCFFTATDENSADRRGALLLVGSNYSLLLIQFKVSKSPPNPPPLFSSLHPSLLSIPKNPIWYSIGLLLLVPFTVQSPRLIQFNSIKSIQLD